MHGMEAVGFVPTFKCAATSKREARLSKEEIGGIVHFSCPPRKSRTLPPLMHVGRLTLRRSNDVDKDQKLVVYGWCTSALTLTKTKSWLCMDGALQHQLEHNPFCLFPF